MGRMLCIYMLSIHIYKDTQVLEIEPKYQDQKVLLNNSVKHQNHAEHKIFFEVLPRTLIPSPL